MSKKPGKNKENLEATRIAFIKIARQEFTEFGYAEASTSRIVEASGMARGSLYYHFGDKHGLFEAVYEDTLREGLKDISKKMSHEKTPWNALTTGAHGFLDLCMDKAFRKITLLEAQSAIPYEKRLQIQEKTFLGKLRTLLPPLLENGYFQGHTENTIAVFIFGILAEIGRTFDSTPDVENARKNFGKAFDATLEMMKPTN